MDNQLETRFLEVRDIKVDGTGKKLTGYAVRYDTLSQDLGGFKERFKPHSFARSLTDGPDVRALAHHNGEKILGRRSAGTVTVEDDPWGVRFEIDVPDTSYGRDLLVSVGRKDIGGMSFAFRAKEDDYVQEGDTLVREVRDADLEEISVVGNPAYLTTSVKIRSSVLEEVERRSLEAKKPQDEPEERQDETMEESRPSLQMLMAIQKQKEAELLN